VIVVSNSSPLIALVRIGQLDLLRRFFGQIHIAAEVWQEVVVHGAGRPADQTARSAVWIESHWRLCDVAALRARVTWR
jgi:predicted nucleic acid-binding protein